MVWHDTPGSEVIPLTVEVTESSMNYLRNPRIGKVAIAEASVQISIDGLAKVPHDGLCLGVNRSLGSTLR